MIKILIDEIEYEWSGGYGAVLVSYERRKVKKNDVRQIAGMLFYAYTIEDPFLFGKTRVSWHPVFPEGQRIDETWLRKFKREIMGCEDFERYCSGVSLENMGTQEV